MVDWVAEVKKDVDQFGWVRPTKIGGRPTTPTPNRPLPLIPKASIRIANDIEKARRAFIDSQTNRTSYFINHNSDPGKCYICGKRGQFCIEVILNDSETSVEPDVRCVTCEDHIDYAPGKDVVIFKRNGQDSRWILDADATNRRRERVMAFERDQRIMRDLGLDPSNPKDLSAYEQMKATQEEEPTPPTKPFEAYYDLDF